MDFTVVMKHLVPGQAGAVWIHVLVWFALVGDHRRLLGRRNLALALLTLPAAAQYDIMLWEKNLSEPGKEWLLGTAFAALFGATALMVVWSLMLAFTRARVGFEVNVPRRALVVFLAMLMGLNTVVIFGRAPEDAGYYTSLGSQRWVETETLPYGDPMLRGPDSPAGGAAATYGPLLYAAHLPFHAAVGTHWNPPDADPRTPEYVRAPEELTKLVCFSFYVLMMASLFLLARRVTTRDNALALLAVYAGSSYLVGLGSNEALSCGLVYLSHVAPTAVTLLALLLLRRPAGAGIALAAAAGLLFYPAFLFPVFLGWFVSRGRGARAFGLGFAITGLLIAVLVILGTAELEGKGAVSLFLESTLEHQEGVDRYGDSPFSFWSSNLALKDTFQSPLFGDTSLFKLSFLLVVGFSLIGFFLARGRSLAQLALLIAAITAAVQLWKTHAGGTYVMWYLPFLLLGLFGRAAGGPKTSAPDVVTVAGGSTSTEIMQNAED